MTKSDLTSTKLFTVIIIFIHGSLLGLFQPGGSLIIPTDIISNNLRNDTESIKSASTDFGNIVQVVPAAVLYPKLVDDISFLLKYVYNMNDSTRPFDIAARGQGHSVWGQACAENGIVINMTSLSDFRNGKGIVVSPNGSYVDVGGEQLWIDILKETLQLGRTPVSWTDYLYLTVGGTLSNAGISGQTFCFGPQINNVMELDVITGKGELTTCSPTENSDLFFGVLGGLGQFGIITRARIVLDKAPTKVKWVRILYSNFSAFTSDQERLIVNKDNEMKKYRIDYLEGSLLLDTVTQDTSFYPVVDQRRILSFLNQHGIIYCLEIAKYYYDDSPKSPVDKEFVRLLETGLNFESGFIFEKVVEYFEFLNRVHDEELKLEKLGLWEVPHPWLNLFVPKSRILDIDVGVFRDIVLKNNLNTGVFLIYPMLRNKWDDRMSAVVPDEDIFYVIGLLFSSGFENRQLYDDQNHDILEFCATAGIQMKQYIPQYETPEDWSKHFGSKWQTFQQRKAQFDPKKILSPGQKIFSS